MVGHDVILSTELLKGIAFHGDFQAPLGFRCMVQGRIVQKHKFLFLLPAFCPLPLEAALKSNLGATKCGKVLLACLAEMTCVWGNSC